MPRSAITGIYTRIVNSFSQPVFGTLIDPTDADAYFDDLDVGLNPPNLAGPLTVENSLTVVGSANFKNGSPWADVMAWGAIGNGIADDTTAIQNAINAVAAGSGGIVFFPPGNYKISSALTISSSYISLIGSGRLSSVIKTTSATANIVSITASYARIDSLGLVGTTGTIATAGTAINASNAQGCKFTNLYISDVFIGIGLSNSTNTLVQFVKMLNIYGPTGLASSNGGGDYIINNQFDPVFYGAYTSASGFGAWAQSTSYSLNAVRSANGGFFVCSQAGTSAAVGTGPAITAFNTQITDGTAKWFFICASTSYGISLTSTSNSNFITNNDISGPWTAGVFIGGSDGNSVLSNTIGQIIGIGVQLGATATNTLVQGNVISGMYGQFAVGVEDSNGSATGSRIVNNFINGTGWYGIFIQSANNIISGNTVTGAGQITSVYGIEVAANVNDFTISYNNIIASAGMTGPIRVNAGTSNFYNIIGNVIDSGTIVDSGSGTTKVVVTTTTGTGSTAVLGTSPVFTTQIQTPLIIGGTAAGSSVSLKATSNGAPSGDIATVNGSTINLARSVGGSSTTVNVGTVNSSAGILTIAGSSSGIQTLQAGAAATGTLTLPIATDTLTGKATTDTLTNKTIDTAGTGNHIQISGVDITRGQILGEATTGNATAGNIGEYIENIRTSGSASSLTSATPLTIAQISLTAGDWDVDCVVYFAMGGTAITTTDTRASLSLVTNTIDLTPGRFMNNLVGAAGATGATDAVNLPNYRFSLSGTTTIFLIAQSTFTGTAPTMGGYGIIRARRVR